MSDPLKFSPSRAYNPLKKIDRLGAEIRIIVGNFISPASINFAATQERVKISLAEIFFSEKLGCFR